MSSTSETVAAKYVWASPASSARVDWVEFLREFDAPAGATGTLHLFAATRYRLRVNGAFVAHGPARYVPGFEEFDSYDLTPLLKPGRNQIELEACFIGVSNFQAMPEPGGRFVAWGEAAGHDLSTPGQWQARRMPGYRDDAPAFSFAIGPTEVVDKAHSRSAPLPLAVSDASVKLAPRSVGYARGTFAGLKPVRAGTLVNDEVRVGFVSTSSHSGHEHVLPKDTKFYDRFATFVHSPVEQEATLLAHWGEHFLNGKRVEFKPDPAGRHMRWQGTATLKAGWNLFTGQVTHLTPAYPSLVGVKAKTAVKLRSWPDEADRNALSYVGPVALTDGQLWKTTGPADEAELAFSTGAHPRRLVPLDQACPASARWMAWDTPSTSDTSPPDVVTLDLKDGAYVLYDLGEEYIGHVQLLVDAPEGTVVRLAYDERLRADGLLDLFMTNPFCDTADQYTLHAGKQLIETFHPRGGRYVAVHFPPGQGKATVHHCRVRSATCVDGEPTGFTTDNELLNWSWQLGCETALVNIEDSFCDSPWRERGTYLLDGYIHTLVHLTHFHDRRTCSRALRLFAQGNNPDGMIPCVVPAYLRKPHGDFSLIYALWLRDYWARTGDLAVVHDCLPAVEATLNSDAWTNSRSDLWDGDDRARLFICWGINTRIRLLAENGPLAMFRVAAHRAAADLYEALGHPANAAQHRNRAETLRQLTVERLWLAGEGRFSPGIHAGQHFPHASPHTDVLALAFGVLPPHLEPKLIDRFEKLMAVNADLAAKGETTGDGFIELSFLKFALDAAVRVKRFDLADKITTDHLGVLKSHNAWGFWEGIARGVRQLGSLSHAWSTPPLEYAHRHTLGLREARPGDPTTYLLQPDSTLATSASGDLPLPQGTLHVSWKRQGENITATAKVPPGTSLLAGPNVTLTLE